MAQNGANPPIAGLMQSWPLTLDKILDHAARWHGKREVVTRTAGGNILRTTYVQMRRRAKMLSNALLAHGVRAGDRVATLAFNSARHMESWYGIMGIGAVCHTLNPRLLPDQIASIVKHAQDCLLLVDETCASIAMQILPKCPSLARIVVLEETESPPIGQRIIRYEDFIAGHSEVCAWGDFDENTAAGLCYTSGTTGDPKGVLYSHRSNFLHTLITLQPDMLGLSARDVILPIVPMFHANAWGLAFSAPAVGAKLVMPGPQLDGCSVYNLLESEGVTCSAAVPTVWQALLQYLDDSGKRLTTLKRVLIGGSACPEVLIRRFMTDHGVEVMQGWGMTEMSPVGAICTPDTERAALPLEQQIPYRLKQGRVPLGVDLEITDAENRPLPHDGVTFGRLKARGPAVAAGYFGATAGGAVDDQGYFDTGDIATIDHAGFMQVTDRAKDVIKSGGEWISSVTIENIVAGHQKVALATVIGIADEKWGERPLLLVKLKTGEQATRAEMLDALRGRVPRWWMPDEVLFVQNIPLTPTGKYDKKLLRERLHSVRLSS